MRHVPLALIVQAALWHLLGPWGAACVAVFGFFMREVTQAEYRWIEANGGLRSAMPWWKGLDVTLWTPHSITDVVLPAGACTAAAAGIPFLT